MGLGKATWNVYQSLIFDREAAGRLSRQSPPERGEETNTRARISASQ